MDLRLATALVVIFVGGTCHGKPEMKYEGFTTLVFATTFEQSSPAQQANVASEQACADKCITDSTCMAFQYCIATPQGQTTNCQWFIGTAQTTYNNPSHASGCSFYYRPQLPADEFNTYRTYAEFKLYWRSTSPLPNSTHAHWMERAVYSLRVNNDNTNGRYSHSGYLNAPDLGFTNITMKRIVTRKSTGEEHLIIARDQPGQCDVVYPAEVTPSQPSQYEAVEYASFVLEAMNLTKIKERTDLKFIGSETQRFVRTNAWQQTVSKVGLYDVTDGTLTFYFSTPYLEGEGPNGYGLHNVPMSVDVEGTIVDSNSNETPFLTRTDFLDYHPMTEGQFGENDFQPDSGLICPGRKTDDDKKMPTIPSQYSARLQETYRVGSVYKITSRHVFYDFPSQLHKVNSLEPGQIGVSDEDFTYTSIIHDFNTDLSYYTASSTGICSVRRLTDSNNDFPDVNVTDDGLYLMTSEAMFNLDKISQYRGRQSVRGVMCDVWIGKDPNFLIPVIGIRVAVSLEVYFISDDEKIYYNGKHLPFYIHLMNDPQSNNTIDLDVRLQYYDIREYAPEFEHYDISRCFTQSELLDFSVTFTVGNQDTSAEQVMTGKEKLFDQIVRTAIRDLTEASPIRFQQIRLSFEGNKVYMVARMSEQIPKDMQTDQDTEKSNSVVYDELEQSTKEGRFIVTLTSEGSADVTLRAETMRKDIILPITLGPVPDPSSTLPPNHVTGKPDLSATYSTGSMAGIGIGLLIIGLLLSAAILFAASKFSGLGTFNRQSQEKLENDFEA